MPYRIPSEESNTPQSTRLPDGLIRPGSVSSLIEAFNKTERARPAIQRTPSRGLESLSNTLRQRREALAAISAFFDPDAVQVSSPQEVSQGNCLTPQRWTGQPWVKDNYMARKNAKLLRPSGHVGGQSAAPVESTIPSERRALAATTTAAGLPAGQWTTRGLDQAGKQMGFSRPPREQRSPLPNEWFPILEAVGGKAGTEQQNAHMEKLKVIGRKHGLEFEPAMDDEEGNRHVHSRDQLQYKIRMRNNRQCHRCGTMYDFYNVCLQCGHKCCHECPRITPTKTERAKKIVRGCCSRKRRSEIQQSVLEDMALPNTTTSGYTDDDDNERPAGMDALLSHIEEAIMSSARGRSRSILEDYSEGFENDDNVRGSSATSGKFAPLPDEDSYQSNDSYSLTTLHEEDEESTVRSGHSASQVYRRGQRSSSDWNSSVWTRDRPDSGRAPKQEAAVNRRESLRRNRTSCMVEHLQPSRENLTVTSRGRLSEGTSAEYGEDEETGDARVQLVERSRNGERQSSQGQNGARTASATAKSGTGSTGSHQTLTEERRADTTPAKHVTRDTQSHQTVLEGADDVISFPRPRPSKSKTSERISMTKPGIRSTQSRSNVREESTAVASSSTGQITPASKSSQETKSSKLNSSQHASGETANNSEAALVSSYSRQEASALSTRTEPSKPGATRIPREQGTRQSAHETSNATSNDQRESGTRSDDRARNQAKPTPNSREQTGGQSASQATGVTSYDQREANARSDKTGRNGIKPTRSSREQATGQPVSETTKAALYDKREANSRSDESAGNRSKPAHSSRTHASGQPSPEAASVTSYAQQEAVVRSRESKSNISESSRNSRAQRVRQSLSDIASVTSYHPQDDGHQPSEGLSKKLESTRTSCAGGTAQSSSGKASTVSHDKQDAAAKTHESTVNETKPTSNPRSQTPRQSPSRTASIDSNSRQNLVDLSIESAIEKPETPRLSHAKSTRQLYSKSRQRSLYNNGLRRATSTGAIPLVVVHLTNQFITQVSPADSQLLAASANPLGGAPTVTSSSIGIGTLGPHTASASVIKRWKKILANSTGPSSSSVGDSGTISSSSEVLTYQWPDDADEPLPVAPTQMLARKASTATLAQGGPGEQASQPSSPQPLRRKGSTAATTRSPSRQGSVAAKAKAWEDGTIGTSSVISEKSEADVGDRNDKKADSLVESGEATPPSGKNVPAQDSSTKRREKESIMKISIEVLREKLGTARKNARQKGRAQLVTDVELRMDVDDYEGSA